MKSTFLPLHDFLSIVVSLGAWAAAPGAPGAVDFSFAPPEWQAAICLPDDPHKSLVDRSGELLYHYGQGGREFATRVGVEVVPGAAWQRQELFSPRIPIVQTFRTAEGLEITEEAFADPEVRQPAAPSAALRRLDNGGVQRNWAQPPTNSDPALKHIALHYGGSLQFELDVPARGSRLVALVLCEGYWNQPGKRVQVLRVEGASPKTVDTVADLGQNRPGVFLFDAQDENNDGHIAINVDAAPGAADQNTILNSLWVAPAEAKVDRDAILAGRAEQAGATRLDLDRHAGPVRDDLILVRVTNTGRVARTIEPRLLVNTTHSFHFEPETRRVLVNEQEIVTSSLKMNGAEEIDAARRVVLLEALTVPAGKSVSFVVRYSPGRARNPASTTVKQALACRAAAVKYWQKAPLPYGRVVVPDAGVQALVDSSIRNIWQAREIKNGLPAFQVGPTCYRGLWIVDGAFLLEAAALLGAGDQARNGVAYELTFQQPDGRIEVMKNFSKENGIVLWTCIRHAQLTQDKAWLGERWPQLERIASHIRTLRQQTLTNSSPLDDGLMPAGFPDGGIGGVHDEYTNPYWNLAGLRAFLQGAEWLGKASVVSEWQKEYDDFLAAFRRAARRDMKQDNHGNVYVPIRMDGQDLPQRGQWGFCHAVYPGQVFPGNDPLVASTLAMLKATEREGMVHGTGWDAAGIWNYFASFYGHAWLWQGDGRKASQALLAFANHAAPILVWREEQSLKGEKFKKVGDMPHNWASAEFIRLAVHLLALDRGDELHLLEGLPKAWLGPGMVSELNGVATPFGPLHLKIHTDRRGITSTLSIKPVAKNCSAIVVHLPGGGTRRMDPQRGGRITFDAR